MRTTRVVLECPRCGGAMIPPRTALSRLDNYTEICPDCGGEEAWEQFALGKVLYWKDDSPKNTEYEVTFTVTKTYTTKLTVNSSWDDNEDLPDVITDIIHCAIQNDEDYLDSCTIISEEFDIPLDIVVASN
jgi:DNA-directed RNA polymerase subunit M/transcription elongation factor TFIIS